MTTRPRHMPNGTIRVFAAAALVLLAAGSGIAAAGAPTTSGPTQPFTIYVSIENRTLATGVTTFTRASPSITWHDGFALFNLSFPLVNSSIESSSYSICISAPTVKAHHFSLRLTQGRTTETPGRSIVWEEMGEYYWTRVISYADANIDPASYDCTPAHPQFVSGNGIVSTSSSLQPVFSVWSYEIAWEALYVRHVAPPAEFKVNSYFSIYPSNRSADYGEFSTSEPANVPGYGGTYGRDGPTTDFAVWNTSGALPPAATYRVCSVLQDDGNFTAASGVDWLQFTVTATINGGATPVFSSTQLKPRSEMVRASTSRFQPYYVCASFAEDKYLGGFSLTNTSLGANPQLPYLEIRNTWAAMRSYNPTRPPPPPRRTAKPPPHRAPPPRARVNRGMLRTRRA